MAATKAQAVQNIERLRQQANAVRTVVELQEESSAVELSLDAARALDAWASKQERVLNADAVHEIEPNASDAELREARVRQAVRRGDAVYLPSWRDAIVGLPNLLLRSELFAATNRSDDCAQEMVLVSYGDTSITFTGVRLNDYDRRVFAACLSHYRMDYPLSDGARGDGWIRITFYQLSLALGVSYGENVSKAIRASLIRLNAAHLRIRARRRNIPMPRLLDVAFEEVEPGTKNKGMVAFRVFESMASLFGPADWTSVSLAALNDYSGLAAWLAAFYSTHKSAYPLRIADLYRLSGVVCSQREFRRRLKNALAQLKSEDAPASVRVAGFEVEGGSVTVHLHRWQELTVDVAV